MIIDCPKCDEVYDSYNNPSCPGCGLKSNIRNSDEWNDHHDYQEDEDEDYSD